MTEKSVPQLAVVGHPNKGKSSLVATLAEDDSVAIGADPGTTIRARAYPMRVDGRHLYTLIDTPGFQRARRVRAWLEERARREGASAADRPRLVADFLAEPEHGRRFPDECELLRPIVEGAGILYVVDGGVPYSAEYEAEMEILRWTGRPSMAVVNPIESRAHVAEWEAALGQFFRVVRVIDALRADFATRRALLLAFGELEAGWREPIETAVAALDADRRARRRAAAREMAELIERALGLTVERRVGVDELPQALAEELEQEYRSALERLEADHRRAVQQIYGHHAIAAHPAELEHLERDLFSEGTWLTFGLRRRDLVTVGAAGGAATGGAIDVAVGGASLLVGVAVGAVIGGALGWLGAGRLAELRILDRPLGGRLARYGPSTNLNFPFVLLGRSRFHWLLVAERTHAMRKSLDLARAPADSLPLESGARRALEKSFRVLRRPRLAASARAGALADLTHRIEEILDQDERRDDRAPIAPEGVTSGARP
jgi:hypothetical protein